MFTTVRRGSGTEEGRKGLERVGNGKGEGERDRSEGGERRERGGQMRQREI